MPYIACTREFVDKSYTSFQVIIETVVDSQKRGWTAIDDFKFEQDSRECVFTPPRAAPAELAHDCTFDEGVCSQWNTMKIPELSFWNVTSSKELESSNIEGPSVDHFDSKDGMY